jgi:hypothetical protein
MSTVTVNAGTETSRVDISVQQLTPTLAVRSVGIGNTAGRVGVEVKQGNSARLFLVGLGVAPGTAYSISGSGVQITQPSAGDFTQTTEGTPAVHLNISVDALAALGLRNILVTNSTGELSVFVGGLQIIPGP